MTTTARSVARHFAAGTRSPRTKTRSWTSDPNQATKKKAESKGGRHRRGSVPPPNRATPVVSTGPTDIYSRPLALSFLFPPHYGVSGEYQRKDGFEDAAGTGPELPARGGELGSRRRLPGPTLCPHPHRRARHRLPRSPPHPLRRHHRHRGLPLRPRHQFLSLSNLSFDSMGVRLGFCLTGLTICCFDWKGWME